MRYPMKKITRTTPTLTETVRQLSPGGEKRVRDWLTEALGGHEEEADQLLDIAKGVYDEFRKEPGKLNDLVRQQQGQWTKVLTEIARKSPHLMKMANNILEFLIDPTVYPVKQRIYFRPEESLQNSFYEGAKADSFKAYGTEQHNSDFYPQRNRQQSQREATDMDRKTMIASLDVLSQHFEENDPIATDLRTMAFAVSKMNEDEFGARMAKAKTFPCPTCGTKVLEATGFCVKCKKKVKPGAAKKAAEEMPWSKEASDMVRKALVSDVLAIDVDMPKEKPEAEEKSEEKPKKDAPAPEKDAPVPEAAPVQAKSVVNTDVLNAAQKLGGVELQASMITADDIGPLSSEEKARLDAVLAFTEFDEADTSAKDKLSSLLNRK